MKLVVTFVFAFLGSASAVTFTNVQGGPNTWVYNLTFGPLDNYSVFQASTTITLNGLTGVTAASGPTSTDFPSGLLNTVNLNWTAQVLNGGTTVVWTNVGGGTGNFPNPKHVFGFSITATSIPNGTGTLSTSGFSRDVSNPLPGNVFNLDISGRIPGPAATTTVLLPQFVFGGGWYSALYFANMGPSGVSFPVSFIGDNGNPLSVPSLGGSSTTVNIGAQGTAILEALNQGTLNQGYVTASLPPGVIGYAVFRQSVPGSADQEAVVPFSLASLTTNTLVFDDTSYVTGIAILNPNATPATVSIQVFDGAGNTLGTSSIQLAARNKTAATLRSLPGLTSGVPGHRGAVIFSVQTSNVAVLGLRFFGAAFTSIPTAGN